MQGGLGTGFEEWKFRKGGGLGLRIREEGKRIEGRRGRGRGCVIYGTEKWRGRGCGADV